MKGFFSWFNSRTKIKRWMFLILVGVCLTCFAFANILESKVLRPKEIIQIVIVVKIICMKIVLKILLKPKKVMNKQ